MYEGLKIDKKFIIQSIIICTFIFAVITISIILLNSRKTVILYEQENQLKNAAMELFKQNSKDLPQNIGDSVNITLKTLIEYDYIKSISDGNKNCDADSYVKVTKIDIDEYQYEPYLICGKYLTEETWDEWSAWSEKTPEAKENVQIEKKILYNYREVSENVNDWSEWTDVEEKENDKNFEYEYKTLYQYQDMMWKWYNEHQKNYADGYYTSAPETGYVKDETQKGWTSWQTLKSGSLTASSVKQIQYRNKDKKVYTDKYHNYDYNSSKYTNRVSWDGTVGNWIYKYYTEGANGYSYSFDSNRTGTLSIRTRTLSGADWQTLTNGSATSSASREVRFRDKKYRYSRYKYGCVPTTGTENPTYWATYVYYSQYDSSPSMSKCHSICDGSLLAEYLDSCFYVSGSAQSKYGDYDRHESNGTATISTGYGRKSWTADGAGQYYDYETYSGTLTYDDARREVQYRDLSNYSSYSAWISKTSGNYSVSDIQDIAYREKLYKYYYVDWNYWSASKESGTYTVSNNIQVKYRETAYKYYKEGPGTTDKYYSEAPAGYPVKLEAESILSKWSEWNATKPEEKEYRTINEKLQMRKRVASGNITENLTRSELEEMYGKTLEELQTDTAVSISTQILYRYRTRIIE